MINLIKDDTVMGFSIRKITLYSKEFNMSVVMYSDFLNIFSDKSIKEALERLTKYSVKVKHYYGKVDDDDITSTAKVMHTVMDTKFVKRVHEVEETYTKKPIDYFFFVPFNVSHSVYEGKDYTFFRDFDTEYADEESLKAIIKNASSTGIAINDCFFARDYIDIEAEDIHLDNGWTVERFILYKRIPSRTVKEVLKVAKY